MLSLGVKLTKDGGHIKTNGELHLEIIAGEIMESGGYHSLPESR